MPLLPSAVLSFGWKTVPADKRVCRICRLPIRYAKDVFEHRRHYPSNDITFVCQACRHERSKAAIEEDRQRLGLAP